MNNAIERIREALHFIPAHDRDTWVRVGMAVKSELGDAGYDLWEMWSQQDESFNSQDARALWKGIRSSGKVTAGTLFYQAKAHGWRDEGLHQQPTPEEIAERQRSMAERAGKEAAAMARERANTAKSAAALWKVATEAKADHPYLVRKCVPPVATMRELATAAAVAILGYRPKSGSDALFGRLLVVPVKRGDGLSTLELIDENGRKATLAGRGTKVGACWSAQQMPDSDGPEPLQIFEGVATALSGKEANGSLSISALSASNLPWQR